MFDRQRCASEHRYWTSVHFVSPASTFLDHQAAHCVYANICRSTCTAWWSEIGSLRSLDTPELHASSDVREPISLHQAVSVPLGDYHKVVHAPHQITSQSPIEGAWTPVAHTLDCNKLGVRWFPRLRSAVYVRVVGRCLRPTHCIIYSKTGTRNFHLTSAVAIESKAALA